MQDYKAYSKALEELIMDQLLPMYLVGCASSGISSDQNKILKDLLEARKKTQDKTCALLRGSVRP